MTFPTPAMETDTQTARMLIVEDDPEMGVGLEDFFTIKGYEVTRVIDGDEAVQEASTLPPYDVVLLDVMLPSKNGFEILREARKAGVDSPVVMLTVKGREKDKLQGFDLGADDYVTKPFSAEELEARVSAVVRRSRETDGGLGTYDFGEITVDFDRHIAEADGEEVQFTALEFDILRYFIEHRGRTVSRKQLLRDVWGISGDITTRTIDRHVASLRKKIEPDATQPQYIETVYGIGYKFVG